MLDWWRGRWITTCRAWTLMPLFYMYRISTVARVVPLGGPAPPGLVGLFYVVAAVLALLPVALDAIDLFEKYKLASSTGILI